MDDYTKLKLHTKRLLKMINSGSVKGNRLYDLKQGETYNTLVKLTKD